MKPILYNATETVFDSYGLGEIDANKVTVTRERNGNYSLYIEYPVGGSLTPLFKQDMRIKSDAGVRTKNQTFYISRIVKDSSHVIKIYAKHISHLTETMGIVHGTIAVGDANAALSRWSESLVGGVEFRTWSDIETEGKTSWTVDKFKTAREALGGVEGSILDVWGGEYEFDNTTIRLHKQLGRKTPTVLQYGRNILSAEEDENSESSYTSIYPYASYTPEADEGGRQADPVFVTLPEKIVDSQWVKMYADRRVQVVDFSSKFAEKETPTLDKLRKMAERYVHDNRIGIPKMSIKVEYVDLAKTLDYADMAFMEEVELCDIVPIFYPKIGLTNEDGKVVVVNYDVLNDRNESIEIGTIGQGMKSAMVGSLGERLEALENRQTRLESNIPAYLLDGKGNKVWYQTPDNTREHKVGDTWFEKNGLYDRIYVWNGEIWEKRIDTEDVDVIAKEIDNKFKDFKSSTKLIEQKAEEALQNAGASTLLAQEAKQIGSDSIAKLEAFKSQITSAQTALSGDLDALKRTIANDIRPKQAQAEAEIAKQVEALVQTKKELAGVKSAQATYEETTTRRLAELTNLANGKASKSELTQTAEELASRIASVQVGGINYYRDSEKIRTSTRFFAFPLHPYLTQENIGETWTLSFDLKINDVGEIRPLHFYHYQSNRFGLKASADITPSKEWQRFTFTGPVIFPNDDPRYSRGEMALYDYAGNNNYSVRRIKLEKGTLATDWSPAIEDIEGQLSTVESNFRQRADSLDAGVRSLTEDLRTKADISALNVTAENIRQSVKSLETDTQNKLDQKLSMAEFEVQAGSIRQEILNATKDKADKTLVVAEAGKLREEFSNLRVGGRNYYQDSDKVRTSTRFFSFPLHLYLSQENIGETWTLSFDIKINEGGEIRPLHFYHYQNNRFGLKTSADITPSKEWQRFTFTGPVIFPNDDPRYSRGEMALYDYAGNNNYSVRRIKLEKGTLATDWSPAIEDTDGLINEAKATFERTAQGLRTDLSAIQEYVNKDGQRQEALQRYTREESAKQATAVRELLTKDYVGKATYQEDVKGINQRIEAVKTSANKDIASQIASYRQSVDGKFTDISSQITTYKQDVGGQISGLSNRLTSSEQGTATQISNLSNRINSNKQGTDNQISNLKTQVSVNKANADSQFANVTNQLARKVETTDFQRVKETSQLYERILGNTENGIADKVARMAMTNQLFQVEVGKAFAEHQNLFLNSTLTKGFLGNNGIINVANATQKEVTSDFISVDPNEKIIFQHWVTLPENGMAWTAWQFFDKNKNPIDNRKPGLNAYKTTVGKQHNINQITVPANAYFVRFSARMYDDGLIKVEQGSAPSDYSVAPNDAIEAVKTVQRQLDGSWSVQNINSAGDIISGVNLGADGINRFIGKLTHITGETLFDRAVIKSAMIADAQINTAHIDSIDAANGRIINLTAKNFTANRVEGLKLIGGDLSATNGAMKIDLNKGQYEVYTEKAALRRVVAGYPNQFIKFDTGIQDVTGNREMKSGVTIIGSNSDGSENGNNQTFAGVQIWNNSQQRNVNSVGDFLRVSNKGYGSDEKGWIIQTIDTPIIAPIVDKNKPETGKRSAIYSGDFYFINKWGQKVSLLGILERFIVNFNTIKDKRGILYTDFSELN